MGKIAKLVLVSAMTRVIVDENASEQEIFEKANDKLRANFIGYDFGDIEQIKDDTECPYGTFDKDKDE